MLIVTAAPMECECNTDSCFTGKSALLCRQAAHSEIQVPVHIWIFALEKYSAEKEQHGGISYYCSLQTLCFKGFLQKGVILGPKLHLGNCRGPVAKGLAF